MKEGLTDGRHSAGRFYNESPRIKGTPCYGCRSCEVLVRRRRMGDEERYWCNERHGYVDPHAISCKP